MKIAGQRFGFESNFCLLKDLIPIQYIYFKYLFMFQNEPLEFENQKHMRDFLLKKYRWEYAIVITISIAVLFARFMNFISNETVGSLLGAIVGYGLGGLRKLHE